MSGSRPKVLWTTKGLKRGGAETLLVELAQSEPLAKFDVHVACVLSTHLDMRQELEQVHVTVHDLGGSRWNPRWVLALWRLLRQEGFAIVHAQSPLPASVSRLMVAMLPRASRPRTVTTEHNVRSLYHPLSRWLNDLTRRFDDLSIAVSEASARSFRRPRPTVVYHGRSRHQEGELDRSSARTVAGIPQDESVVLTIANLRPEKDLGVLLQAFAQARSRSTKRRLVIIGDGACKASLTSQARELGLDDCVDFLGSVDNARALLPMADVFALSSRYEGLPVAVIEAQQAGVPVVATAVGGLPEIVEDGVSGILVEPGDVSGLSSALERVLDDQHLCARLVRGAWGTVARFDAETMAASYARLYRGLVEGTGHPRLRQSPTHPISASDRP